MSVLKYFLLLGVLAGFAFVILTGNGAAGANYISMDMIATRIIAAIMASGALVSWCVIESVQWLHEQTVKNALKIEEKKKGAI